MTYIRSAVAVLLALIMSAGLLVEAPDAVAQDEFPLSVVVKLTPGSVAESVLLTSGTTGVEPLLPSRGIYRAQSDFYAHFNDKGEIKIEGDAKKWAKEVAKLDGVMWAEPDLAVTAGDLRFHSWQFRAMPNGLLNYSSATASADQPAFEDLHLAEAHAQATGSGVRIAILDTGIDAGHELLAGRVFGQYDLVDDDFLATEEANGVDDDQDGSIDEAYGHGTFVAGVVAQVAPDAELYAIRVINDDGIAELYSLIEAIDMAIELDIDVINMSFGLADYKKIDALDDAIKRAKDAEIIIVAAAGNLGDERRSYPASDKYVVSVAAGEHGDSLASFSSRGKWVQVAAPGVDIVSSIPGGYGEWTGTSMATPVATGVLAQLLEINRSGKPKDAIKALFEGTRKLRHKDNAEKGMIDPLASLDRIR